MKRVTARSLSPQWWFAISTTALCALGLLFVFAASVGESYALFGHPFHFVSRQARWFVIGGIALLVGRSIPLKLWQKTAWMAYAASLVSLLLVFVPGLGRELNGAHRWIFIGSYSFQPVEFVKLSLVLLFSSWLTHHQRLLPFAFLTSLPALIILLQPDVGSLLIVLSIAFGMFFMAGGELKSISLAATIGVALLAVAIVLAPYRLQRVTTFLDPESDPTGASFHIRQITLALGNGGLFGQGFGNSKQKYTYIPEASTDSIFAIISEELGFVGGVALIGLFMTHIWLGFRLVNRAPAHSFAWLVGYGLMIWLAAQIVLNLAAVVALVPLTGVPLPYISYGGSSLLMVMFATGMIMKVGSMTEKDHS